MVKKNYRVMLDCKDKEHAEDLFRIFSECVTRCMAVYLLEQTEVCTECGNEFTVVKNHYKS